VLDIDEYVSLGFGVEFLFFLFDEALFEDFDRVELVVL